MDQQRHRRAARRAAMLSPQAAATYTDPNGNTTAASARLVWPGRDRRGGRRAGNVATSDLNSNGLPTVTIDQVNRMTLYSYDSLGNISAVTNPDGTTQSYIYNSVSEPTAITDEEGGVTPPPPLYGAIPNGTFFPPRSFFYCPVLIASARPRLEQHRTIPDPFRGGPLLSRGTRKTAIR